MNERGMRRLELPAPLYERLAQHARFLTIPTQTLCRMLLAEQMDKHAPALTTRILHEGPDNER